MKLVKVCSRFLSVLVLCSGLSVVLGASAEAKDEKHDEGLFLRLGAGPSYGHVWNYSNGHKVSSLSGFSYSTNISLGGAISENLILHFSAMTTTTLDATLKDKDGKDVTSIKDPRFNTAFMGGGLTYYLPSNFYFTGNVGAATISTWQNDGTHSVFNAGTGYAGNLLLGKEWWISRDWGLGLAAHVDYTVCPSPNTKGVDDIKALSYGLLLSATYN